jgi:hypothetical protein
MFASGSGRENSTKYIASNLDEEDTSDVTWEPDNVSDTEEQYGTPTEENARFGYQARSDYVTKEPAQFLYQNRDPTRQVGWSASRNPNGPTTYAVPSAFSNQDGAQPRQNTLVEYPSPYSSPRGQAAPSGSSYNAPWQTTLSASANEYRSQYSSPREQTGPSGFGFHPAQARSPYLAGQSPPVPDEAQHDVPVTSVSRPQSMITCAPISYSSVPRSGVEESISYYEDPIDNVTRNIASSNISESDFETPDLYDDESVGKATRDISQSNRSCK